MGTSFEQLPSWVSAAVFGGLGLLVGSFANVVYLRLKKGQSIAWPGSHCPTCSHPLAWRDLVPVLSFVWLKGRCRYCQRAIWSGYPTFEATCAGAAAASAWMVGWAGGVCSLGLWIAGAALLARLHRVSSDQRGFTLVEVLVAILLLAGVSTAVFRTLTASQRSLAGSQQRTKAVGLARTAIAAAAQVAHGGPAPLPDHRVDGPYVIDTAVAQRPDLDDPLLGPTCWWITVNVTCPTCWTAGAQTRVSEVVCR